MILSRYCKIYSHPGDTRLRTLVSTRTMAVAEVLPEVILDIEKNRLSGGEKKTLKELGFIVASDQADTRNMLRFIDGLNEQSDAFNAIVVLTLDCNLACRYCFEGTRKGRFYMSAETADDFVDFVKAYNFEGKDEINIVFYGGEPLLNTDIILRISEKLGAFAQSNEINYSFSFVTNGTLLTARSVEKLKPLGLDSAAVTLDGPRDLHDTFRPFQKGEGSSFDAIIRNILDVSSLMDIQIGGNFTREHYREFPRLLDYFLEKGITPDRVSSVNFTPVVRERSEFAPPDFHDGCMSPNEPWLAGATLFLREEILKRGFQTQELLPTVCAVERSNVVVVNYDGMLYKCPGLIGRKEYCIGGLKKGILDYRTAHCLGNWKNEECLACAYLPLCFGGCRYMKLVRDGNMHGVDCKKGFFDNTLEAVVRQDLRYQMESE